MKFNTWLAIRSFFSRQALSPFEAVFGFFCIYSGIAGIFQFGTVSDVFVSTLGNTIATIFNVVFILAGMGMFFGLGTIKRHIEAFGLILVATSLVIRSIVFGAVVGFNAMTVNAYVSNFAFIMACVVRLLTINYIKSLPVKLKLLTMDALIIADIQGNIAFWPQSAQDMFGYTETEALHKPLTLIIPERYRLEHIQGVKELGETGKSDFINKPVNITGLHKNGTEFPVKLIIRRWDTGSCIYYIGTIRNEKVWDKLAR